MHTLPLEMLNNCLITMLIGAILGLFYDMLSFVKTLLSNKTPDTKKNKFDLFTFFRDIIFCITFTVFLILILYYFNDGDFRGIFFFTLIAGLAIYRFTLSKPAVKIMTAIGMTIRKIILLILTPIRKLIFFVVRIIKNLIPFLSTPIAKISSKLYNKNTG